MPRQNTSPADFPPAILAQIERLAQCMVATRKSRGETQAQWAARLGISQPTMARLERGDASVAMATYVACLWQINPALDLTRLLASDSPAPGLTPTAKAPDCIAIDAGSTRLERQKPLRTPASKTPSALPDQQARQAAQIEHNFAAAKAALDFFKSPRL